MFRTLMTINVLPQHNPQIYGIERKLAHSERNRLYDALITAEQV